MAAHYLQSRTKRLRIPTVAQHDRSEVLLDKPDGACGVLGVIARPAQGDTFAPAVDAIGVDGFYQHYVTDFLGSETGSKRAHQGDLQRVQPQSLDRHRTPSFAKTYEPARSNPTTPRPAAKASRNCSRTLSRHRKAAAGSAARSATTSSGISITRAASSSTG